MSSSINFYGRLNMASRKVAGRAISSCRTRGWHDRYDYVLQLRLREQRFDRIIRIYM